MNTAARNRKHGRSTTLGKEMFLGDNYLNDPIIAGRNPMPKMSMPVASCRPAGRATTVLHVIGVRFMTLRSDDTADGGQIGYSVQWRHAEATSRKWNTRVSSCSEHILADFCKKSASWGFALHTSGYSCNPVKAPSFPRVRLAAEIWRQCNAFSLLCKCLWDKLAFSVLCICHWDKLACNKFICRPSNPE